MIGLYELSLILIVLILIPTLGLIILYFIVKHAVRTGVAEAMREALTEFRRFKAKKEKEE